MSRVNRRCRVFHFLCLALWVGLLAPAAGQAQRNDLPQDSGVAGLKQELLRLRTTARLMHTTAHPDDEDGGMLVLEARGKGVTALLLTLNRGEGGQNKVGSNLFDELGVLRTLELLASDRHYGVEQRFTRVADFGYSKSAQETFEKWRGHETALADMVRVIRTFRPDVLVSRFQGAARDGHGHHEAAGILSREAFRAAADPNRFPEQLREGLQPWQAKKLYMDNVRGTEDYTLQLDTGATNAALGMSSVQFAMEGLRHQLSQGAGSWQVSPGPHFSYYKLIDSALPNPPAAGAREKDFFDGIDTTLPGLASRLGAEESKAPFLRPALAEIEGKVNLASAAADQEPSRAAPSLLAGLGMVNQLSGRVESSSLSPAAKADLLAHLRTKQEEFERAANLALGLALETALDGEASAIIVPGQTFTLTARLHNGGNTAVEPKDIALDLPPGWKTEAISRNLTRLKPGAEAFAQFRVSVPPDAAYTRPYFRREDPEKEIIYRIEDPRYLTLPLPPPPLQVRATYAVDSAEGVIRAPAEDGVVRENGRHEKSRLAVAPALSVLVGPATLVIPSDLRGAAEVNVDVGSNVSGPVSASLQLDVPAGWRAQPASQPVTFARQGQHGLFSFQLSPGSLKEGRYQVRASARYQGRDYALGYSVVAREDLDTFYYYQPAMQNLSVVDVKVPRNLRVGYIMGAGDDIPTILKQIGLDVEIVSPEELAGGDLSRYGTIIVGIRAYDTRSDVREHKQRLLDYVSNGGTLLVQYNSGVADFNSGQYTPFPTQLSRDRVTVEEAPVEILAPQDNIFQFPNTITARDFEGWVQERGLYFMNQWDSRFQPLLASHDPGEQPLQGGLLRARYGKGTYIYTGYAFFRQLPVGVPGAIRLYVNLLSAGHEAR